MGRKLHQPVPLEGSTTIRLSADPWRSCALFSLALLCVALLDRAAGGTLAPLYSLPVALTALRLGWIAGLTASLFASALLLFLPATPVWPAAFVHAFALLCLGLAAGWLGGRERQLRLHYQKAAEQLSSVYEKVQANFEGMKRAERLSALGQLSAGLAHEIRNPLASISGAASILRRNQALDPKNARCVEIIAGECERLNGLLTNFLNFARPRPPRFQTIEIGSVLDNVLSLASHGVRGKTVRFQKRVEAGLPLVDCDPEQLEQVLLNLMINAIDASPEGDAVDLSASREGERVAVRVTDRGHGVSPAHVDRLFDPFFTTKEHGTGLGLPVAHQIMRQMGGSLLAENNSGQGMTFTVILPAKQSDQ